jgi:hypothetical protein
MAANLSHGIIADPHEVSLIALVVTPERFDGQHVSVAGFGVFEFETVSLYLSRLDAELEIRPHSIPLVVEQDIKELRALHGRYVFVKGKFSVPKGGRRGRIHSIDSIEPIAPLRSFESE